MRYHLPVFGDGSSVGAERIGGLPTGLPAERWPRCGCCGKPQSLVAQFEHDADRLDLGRAGRSLLVFQCEWDPGICATWELFSAANASLIVEPEDRSSTPTPAPDLSLPIIAERPIVGWTEHDDGVPPEEAGLFFVEESYWTVPEETVRRLHPGTRLGSVPLWIQSPDEAPRPGWRFLGQIGSEDGPNFGDGLAYLFLNLEGEPRAAMFWQCG